MKFFFTTVFYLASNFIYAADVVLNNGESVTLKPESETTIFCSGRKKIVSRLGTSGGMEGGIVHHGNLNSSYNKAVVSLNYACLDENLVLNLSSIEEISSDCFYTTEGMRSVKVCKTLLRAECE